MKLFNPNGLVALNRIFEAAGDVNPVHEHTALCVNTSLDEDRRLWAQIGFKVVLQVPEIAVFLAPPTGSEMRIELIQRGVTEHEAWVVKTRAEWNALDTAFSSNHEWEYSPKTFVFDHLWAKMFRHTPTGGVAQFVWRAEPVYEGLFQS